MVSTRAAKLVGPAGRVVALDISEGMLQQVRVRMPCAANARERQLAACLCTAGPACSPCAWNASARTHCCGHIEPSSPRSSPPIQNGVAAYEAPPSLTPSRHPC